MFNYLWKLKNNYDVEGVEKHEHKVFSTFACGGGSTMGYKLAGYTVIGANDIDPKMAKVYKENHNPKYYFLCPVWKLLEEENLPKELYNLDILDGSPPCSTFSLAGSRDKVWKQEKKFREGQEKQVLSDLFFDWIKLVKKLQPKVAIAENVKWMIIWNAKMYTKKIVQELNAIGYDVQIFCLNSATMGIPQARERIFFICKKKQLNFPKLTLSFSEKMIPYREINEWIIEKFHPITQTQMQLWKKCKPWKNFASVHPTKSFFNHFKISLNRPLPTLTAGCKNQMCHPIQPRHLTNKEVIKWGSFPKDYNFLDVDPIYLVWMSVPPVMMAHIAYQVYIQWFGGGGGKIILFYLSFFLKKFCVYFWKIQYEWKYT